MSFGGLIEDQKYFENTKNTLRASKSFQICGLRNMTNFKDCFWVSFWNAECVYFSIGVLFVKGNFITIKLFRKQKGVLK